MSTPRYYPIHVGKRWSQLATWGVCVEGKRGLKLLAVGLERPKAAAYAAKLNERGELGARVGLVLALGLLLAGCAAPGPLKGGKASTQGPTVAQSVMQSENPAAVSSQDQETVRTRTYTVPAGSRLESSATNGAAVVVSAAMPVTEREETRAKTELGAAQKDTAREIGAKLASLKGVVWVGMALFLAGLGTLFYPPLRALVGSVTTSAAILAGGLALMVLPTLVVGNELLILAGVGVAVGGWFLAHRYGKMRGFIDANKNGVDDRTEAGAGEVAR